MSATKEQFQGQQTKDLETKGREELEKALNNKKEQHKPEPEPEKKQEQKTQEKEVKPSKEVQDANDEEDVKYDNILKNTFGFGDGEIDPKARKLAKSWAEMQSMTTKTKQEKQQLEQVVNGLDSLTKKYPKLYEDFKRASEGRYEEENPSQEPSGQPDIKGQLEDDSVTEEQLIKSGYLSKSEIEGLDELAKQRKIFNAEAKYIRQQEREALKKELRSERDNLRKEDEQNRITQENKRRAEEGFDKFIRETGTNLSEVSDEEYQKIQRRMLTILDPDDPRMIAEDAFEIAAERVLGVQKQPQQQRSSNIDELEDTGVTFNRQQTRQKGKVSLEQQLRERAVENFHSRGNPKNYKKI